VGGCGSQRNPKLSPFRISWRSAKTSDGRYQYCYATKELVVNPCARGDAWERWLARRAQTSRATEARNPRRGTRQLQREVEADSAGPQTSGRVWSARESQRLASGPRVSAARHACGAWAEMGWRGGWRGKWARSLTVGPVAQFFFYSIPDFNYPNQISSFVLNSRFKVKKSLHELYFCSLQ
jgi:hypothetical protein